MDYAMRQPWWLMMNEGDDLGRRAGRGRRRAEGVERREGRRGRPRGTRGREGFGPGEFEAEGLGRGFGPGGPGGPGPMGFGPGRHHGPGVRRARRGDVRLAVLALLLEQPCNGYQLIQGLAEKTNGVWKPSPGAVYPQLSALEDEGLIEAFDNDGAKAFRLTETGRGVATDIDPKPWDAVNDEFGPLHPDDAVRLWRAYGSLAMATKAVMTSGTSEQIADAEGVLTDARRRLFGLLAEDDADKENDRPE